MYTPVWVCLSLLNSSSNPLRHTGLFTTYLLIFTRFSILESYTEGEQIENCGINIKQESEGKGYDRSSYGHYYRP